MIWKNLKENVWISGAYEIMFREPRKTYNLFYKPNKAFSKVSILDFATLEDAQEVAKLINVKRQKLVKGVQV